MTKEELDRLKYKIELAATAKVMLNLVQWERDWMESFAAKKGIKHEKLCSHCPATWMALCNQIYPLIKKEKKK